MFASNDRRLSAALTVIGVLLLAIAGTRLVTGVGNAGDQQLQSAKTAISQVLRPALARQNMAQLRRAAVVLIADPASRFSYVSIRDERGQLLASVGSRSGVFAWLPDSGSRSLRAWLYRNLSARQMLSVSTIGGTDVRVGFGLSWSAVLANTWRDWWWWLALCGIGLACVIGGLLGMLSKSSPVAADASDHPWSALARTRPARAANTPAGPTARRSWRGVLGGRAATLARLAGKRPTAPRSAPVGDFEKIAATRLTATAGSQMRSGVGAVAPFANDEAVPGAVDRELPVETPSVVRPPAGDPVDAPSFVADSIAPISQPTPLVLDDKTLDIRFHPIWRGAERALLAGGWATLIWRSGDGAPVAPGTLARLAEQAGGLAAFTCWLAERVTMLQSNWRALEFSTVPIVLPFSAELLDFSDVWRIWRDVLTRVELERRDLLLQLDAPIAEQALALPVRRMIALTDADMAGVSGCDMLFVRPQAGGCCRQAEQALQTSRYSMLLGPLSDPVAQAGLLAEQSRIAWFSGANNEHNLLTPRRFARLVSRHELAPL